MKLSVHFDLLNERPRCRIDGDGGERRKSWGKGANLSDTHPGARCSNLSRLFRENRIFMLTRTRPWDSPKFVHVAVGYLWTAVNKAPVEHGWATAQGMRAKLSGDK